MTHRKVTQRHMEETVTLEQDKPQNQLEFKAGLTSC